MERETCADENMEVQAEDDPQEDSLSSSELKLYEAQFFGFTPQTCMLRVCSAFQDSLYEILPVVEKVCVRQLSEDGSPDTELQLQLRARECSRRLQQFMDERFKRLSKRIEAPLLSHCFTVPANVLLPEDQIHKAERKDLQEVMKIELSLADLQKSYEAEVCGRQALLAELEEQKEVQKQLNGILEFVGDLQGAWVKEGNGNFHESFPLVMESTKKLQEAVQEVLGCSKTSMS